MTADAPRVVVVGAANVDLEAATSGAVVPGDSNPGTLRRSAGGVGRNVAESLARLGVATSLVTVLDDDPLGRWLADVTASAGVDLSSSEHRPGSPSTYVSVVDAAGELVVAVNDMRGVDAVDGDFLAARRDLLASAGVLVVDANLPAGAIDHLAATHPDATVVAEPVSAVKASRLREHLGWVHTVKPNREELAVLAGRPLRDEGDLDAAVDVLLTAGVSQVVVSLGRDGCLVATPDGRERLRGPAGAVRSVTGAGDAMTAGIVLGVVEGWPLARAARFGLAMAVRTAGVASSVDPTLTRSSVEAGLASWT